MQTHSIIKKQPHSCGKQTHYGSAVMLLTNSMPFNKMLHYKENIFISVSFFKAAKPGFSGPGPGQATGPASLIFAMAS